jgi:hypothetical protein
MNARERLGPFVTGEGVAVPSAAGAADPVERGVKRPVPARHLDLAPQNPTKPYADGLFLIAVEDAVLRDS